MVSAKVISIGAAQITAQIGALARKVQNPGEGFMIAGRAVQNDLKKHFRWNHHAETRQGFGDPDGARVLWGEPEHV
jgi:hypothetical protein